MVLQVGKRLHACVVNILRHGERVLCTRQVRGDLVDFTLVEVRVDHALLRRQPQTQECVKILVGQTLKGYGYR